MPTQYLKEIFHQYPHKSSLKINDKVTIVLLGEYLDNDGFVCAVTKLYRPDRITYHKFRVYYTRKGRKIIFEGRSYYLNRFDAYAPLPKDNMEVQDVR